MSSSKDKKTRDRVTLKRECECAVEIRKNLNGTLPSCASEPLLSHAHHARRSIRNLKTEHSRIRNEPATSSTPGSTSVRSVLQRLSSRISELRSQKESGRATNQAQVREEEFRIGKHNDERDGHATSGDEPACVCPSPMTECSPEDYRLILQQLNSFKVRDAAADASTDSPARPRSPTRAQYEEYARAILSRCNPGGMQSVRTRKRSPVG